MPKDERLYEKVAMLIKDLDVNSYSKILLSSMVYRKIRHPKEHIKEIIDKVTKTTVPEIFKERKGKPFLAISVKKELESLECELHACSNLPDDLERGNIVSNTVKYYAAQFMQLD